jgi:hypothetical protein
LHREKKLISKQITALNVEVRKIKKREADLIFRIEKKEANTNMSGIKKTINFDNESQLEEKAEAIDI